MPLRNVRAQCNLLYNLSITRSIDNFHGYLIRSRIYVHMYIRKFYVFGISLEKCFLRPFRTRSKFRNIKYRIEYLFQRYYLSCRITSTLSSRLSSREGEKKIPTIFDSFFLLSIDICKPNLTFLKIRIGVYEYVEEYKISEAKQC